MRTERHGRSLGLGTCSSIDDTIDRWTDVQCYVARDGRVKMEFKRMSSDGRRVLDTYECFFDDETALMDLAVMALHGVVGMQATDDMLARFREDEATTINALDDPESTARKLAARQAMNASSRRRVRRVKSKSGASTAVTT